MANEPKIRVAVSKSGLQEDVHRLRVLLSEYVSVLEQGAADPGDEWSRHAAEVLQRHAQQLAQGNLSLQTMDLAAAVILQVFALRPGGSVTLLPGASPAPADGLAGWAPTDGALTDGALTAPESLRELIAEINALSAFAPLALQERLRFLLGCLVRVDDLARAGDESRLDAVLAEINLLTSGRASQALLREIGLLARSIYNSIDALSKGLPLNELSTSSDGISEAVRKIRGVTQRLEQVATQNLDILERFTPRLAKDDAVVAGVEAGLRRVQQQLAALQETHGETAAPLQRVRERLSDSAAATVMQLRLSNARHREMNLQLISNQSFQDLTGQTLKKIVTFVESLQMQLMALLEKYQTVLTFSDALPTQSPPPPAPQGTPQSQDQVDSLLAKLGF